MLEMTLRSIPVGERDTIKLLRKRGIFIDWQARYRLERGMRGRVRGVFRRIWKRVVDAQLRSVFQEDAELEALYFELLAVTEEYAQKAFELGAIGARERINAIAGMDFAKDPAREWLKGRSMEFAEKFTTMTAETVQKTVFKVVDSGLQKGWSITKMKQEMSRQYGIALRRGEVIARTTVIKAHNMGSMLQSKEMGLSEMELVGCDPECEECQDIIANNPYPVDEAMDIEAGIHPNHTGSWVATQASVEAAMEMFGAPVAEPLAAKKHVSPAAQAKAEISQRSKRVTFSPEMEKVIADGFDNQSSQERLLRLMSESVGNADELCEAFSEALKRTSFKVTGGATATYDKFILAIQNDRKMYMRTKLSAKYGDKIGESLSNVLAHAGEKYSLGSFNPLAMEYSQLVQKNLGSSNFIFAADTSTFVDTDKALLKELTERLNTRNKMRVYGKAQHKYTEAMLREALIEQQAYSQAIAKRVFGNFKIKVYRGVRYKRDVAAKMLPKDLIIDDKLLLPENPLNSWTPSSYRARTFLGGDDVSILYERTITNEDFVFSILDLAAKYLPETEFTTMGSSGGTDVVVRSIIGRW